MDAIVIYCTVPDKMVAKEITPAMARPTLDPNLYPNIFPPFCADFRINCTDIYIPVLSILSWPNALVNVFVKAFT